MLSFIEFLEILVVIYDALNELTELSLKLQKRNKSLTEAQNTIKHTIKVLEPGEYHKNALKAAENKTFRDIQSHE